MQRAYPLAFHISVGSPRQAVLSSSSSECAVAAAAPSTQMCRPSSGANRCGAVRFQHRKSSKSRKRYAFSRVSRVSRGFSEMQMRREKAGRQLSCRRIEEAANQEPIHMLDILAKICTFDVFQRTAYSVPVQLPNLDVEL